ncbi:MAG: polysaccharide biosynthesis protein [Candidatus Sumerlaeaceae bacterium]|nr:polysaccharide biosynthesis protein [Candidatus Sumerlaeaceae bacterium]
MNTMIKWQRLGLVAMDAVLVALALYMGYALRFNFDIRRDDYNQYLLVVGLFVVVRLFLFWAFNLYRGILRYASTTELVAIFASSAIGSVALAAANVLVIPFVPAMAGLPEHAGHLQRVPWPALIIEFSLTILLVGGGRFSRRFLVSVLRRREDSLGVRRVLVVGAGDAGEAVVRMMRHAAVRAFEPVAFADDDPNKQHRRIHGIPVAGSTKDLGRIIDEFGAEEVLIALPRVGPEKLNEIVHQCEHARVGFKILPSVQDVLSGRVSVNQIRPVEIEDLLGRDEIELELPADRNYIKDEVILITGAGGSIGSELCRQLLKFGPKQIVLMGKGENSIYEISTELAQAAGDRIASVIGDIRDESKLQAVAAQYKPSIFFHAAAHKHVPLMEAHPDEAVKNNIVGTRNVARLADTVGAKKFILISSDKAVRPTNVMGATKRVAEMIVFCLARTSKTQFAAVRFGNVLGSRGSVIPLFKRQIARGGPITVTHPDVTRYFMTIPEAVSLVIEAGSAREQRRLYLLDMGQPVKISDLARNLIRLSGFDPDKEIGIQFTGMRPGEKLIEELLTAGEDVKATDMGKIFITEPDEVDCGKLWVAVDELARLAQACDSNAIRAGLRELVPDYTPETAGER